MPKKIEKKKVSFHQVGYYSVAFRPLLELLGYEVIMPPPLSRRTMELGFKHSPETACIPFKISIGNYIEAIEKGANVLAQAGGGCRFGLYAEVQDIILKDLGYKVEFIKLENSYDLFNLIKRIKKLGPKISDIKMYRTIYLSYLKARAIEKIEDYMRKNIGFEKGDGEMEGRFKEFIAALDKCSSILGVRKLGKEYLEKMSRVQLLKPKHPIRVVVVGEVYILMEPFSNFNIEKTLGKKGVEIHRVVTATDLILQAMGIFKHKEKMLKEAKPYLTHHIGGHGTESVGLAHKLIKKGFDGVIHVKPFGCIPEINAMPALYNLSRDYKVPILYFSFDSLTSENGVNTRLDAFADMLIMRREKNEKSISRI